MDDRELTELRKVVGLHEKLVYEAIKRGMVAELPHEGQFYARALQEHLHLKHKTCPTVHGRSFRV
jgi:hypothetical protein